MLDLLMWYISQATLAWLKAFMTNILTFDRSILGVLDKAKVLRKKYNYTIFGSQVMVMILLIIWPELQLLLLGG